MVGDLAGIIAHSSGSHPNFAWSDLENFTELSLYNETVSVDKYRQMVKAMVTDMFAHVDKLFHGMPAHLRDLDLEPIYDNHQCQLAGYSVTREPRNIDLFHSTRERLLQHLSTIKDDDGRHLWVTHVPLTEEELESSEPGQTHKLEWNLAMAKEFLAGVVRLREFLPLVFYSVGLPSRVEELMTCLITDTQVAKRSLLWWAPRKQYILILRYVSSIF